MNHIVSGSRQFMGETARQLRVHEKFHAVKGSMRLTRLSRAP
jgi:hypothetical protein